MKPARPSPIVWLRMAELAHSRRRPRGFALLNLGTLGVFLAWLALACYAIVYLLSR